MRIHRDNEPKTRKTHLGLTVPTLALMSGIALTSTPVAYAADGIALPDLEHSSTIPAGSSDIASQNPGTNNGANPLLAQLTSVFPGGGSPGIQLPSVGPDLTVDNSQSITPGETVKINGRGYAPGEKIYLTQTIEKPTSGYPTTYGPAVKVTVNPDGTFQSELTIDQRFGNVDCAQTQCYVASFTAFPKLWDRSQDKWVPIRLTNTTDAPSEESGQNNNPTGGQAATNAESPASTTASGGAQSHSTSGATVRLSKSSGLRPDGDVVRVTGSGFSTSGQGIYVGIAQRNQFSTTNADAFGPDTVWVSRSKGNLSADGSFSIDLPVSAKFGNADCVANSCAIYTLAAHGSSDRSQDTATPVSFEGGVVDNSVPSTPATSNNGESGAGGFGGGAPGTTTSGLAASGAGANATSSARVSLSRTSIAPTGSTPITVTGQGFKTTGNGVYVGVAEVDKFSTTNSAAFGAVAWVKPKQISSDGSFTTTLNVEPAFSAGNCITNKCALYTFAAHGSSDRSQDTITPLTVEGTAAEKAAAVKAAEEKQAKKEAAKKARKEKAQKQADSDKQAAGANSGAEGEKDSSINATLSGSQRPLVSTSIIVILAAAVCALAVALVRERRKTKNQTDSE